LDLFILRHGEAEQRVSTEHSDFDRPLTAAGQEEVLGIAKSLNKLGIKFDIVVTSPLKRAHQTAMIAAKVFNNEQRVEEWNELKPEGNRLNLYHKLSQFKEQSSILLVGHEPYLSEVVSELIFEGNSSGRIVLKKAGLARIRIISSTPKLQGELIWLLAPSLLENMSK